MCEYIAFVFVDNLMAVCVRQPTFQVTGLSLVSGCNYVETGAVEYDRAYTVDVHNAYQV